MKTVNFTVGQFNYVAEQLNAFDQLHVVRKIAPVFAALVPPGAEMKSLSSMLNIDVSVVLPNVADVLARLPEEDVNALMLKLLSVVRREQPNHSGWAPMVASGRLMFDDLKVTELMQIAVKSGQHSLGDFLSALPQLSSGAAQKQSAQ